MAERKFTQNLRKIGNAAKIREEVAQQMRENIILQRPKSVDPVDYETYVTKNKVLLINDPQREMLTFPHDDVVIPPPNPAKKMRTVHNTVPATADREATSLLVRECIKSYTGCCHVVKYRYSKYSGGYNDLPIMKKQEPLPQHVFEVDAEEDEKDDLDMINRNSVAQITKAGWLYKGPDGGKENIMGFTRQFKRRFFLLKQQADFTYILEIYKDEKKIDSKGAVFLELAIEAVKSPKKGKHCFELRVHDRVPYVFAADNEADMLDWIQVLNKVINAAETASNISMERIKEEASTPDKTNDNKVENSMHPELQKYSRETENSLSKARQEGRQNVFRVYPYMNTYIPDDDDDSDNENEIDVFPKKISERFMLQLLDFKMKLRINLSEEGMNTGNKLCNPEPFFITFALFDVKEGRKISEDFHMDPNEPEIRGMIPPEVLHASDRLHTVAGKTTTPDLNGLDENWALKNRQGIFSVICCHSEVYLFARIEKVLQGPMSQAIDPYLKTAEAGRMGSKVFKTMKQFCNNIGHHRQPFGWAARQLVSSNYGPSDLHIYKHDGSKMSEDDVIKHLQDLRKPEKQGKLQEIPGVLKISLHKLGLDQSLPNTLTPSLVPIKPFPVPPPNPPAVEIDEFVSDRGQLCDTFDSCINNLYVYPLSLKYEHQKSFPKARNIACCVEIRDSDEDKTVPLKAIYGRPEVGLFTTVASTAILHHNTSPDFLEEVKIALPLHVTERHHILFRFYHISCEGSKTSNRTSTANLKKREQIESPVGYSWLPLLHAGRMVVGEQTLPVTQNLPQGYLAHEIMSGGRGHVGQELKLVDSGKHIFKVKVLLRSTVYTKDQHLHNFFYHCQKLQHTLSPGSDHESINKLKSLHASDVSTYVQFLPTILNQLFSLLTRTICEDVAVNAVKVLIHIISEVTMVDRAELLHKYVKYIFKPDPVLKGSKQKTVHEELARNLTTILRPAIADHLVVTKFMQHSWFFFEVLIKSMTLFLVDADRYKMPRNERFHGDYQYRIETLLQTLAPNITQKYREMPRETKNANNSLAIFVKMCFTLMDRGFVFRLISSYIENFSPGDPKTLQDFKFEFLRIVCSHEHYIPLSLPMMRKGMIKTFKDLKCDYTLSEEFRKQHYLAGLLLQELKMALGEPKEVRRQAIMVLRNQLAKHSFDDRYSTKTQQGRIAALYLPLISILMENKQHLTDDHTSPSVPPPSSALIPNGDAHSVSSREHKPHSSSASQKTVTFGENVRDSKVFAMIAGTGAAPAMSLAEMRKNQMNGSNSSLTSSTSSMEGSKKSDSGRDKKSERGHGSLLRSHSSVSTPASPQAMSSKPSSVLLRYQKLDVVEVKDLLLCFLYILKHLPEDILLGWFNNSSEFDIIDFFSILEVCLHHFKYQGRKKIHDLSVISDTKKASTMPYTRRSTPSVASSNFAVRAISQYGDVSEPGFHMPSSSDAEGLLKALQDANMSTEIGLIFLDILSLYCATFKRNLEHKDGDNSLMKKIFSLYLSFLQTSQSEHLQKHVFAAWRSFIKKFPSVLFRGNAALCGDLCYEILRCCNSKLYSTRKEACALLYLLMRANFEFTKKKSFTRVHLQVIISVSQLIGDVVGLSNTRFQESLAMINSYATSDKAMQGEGKGKKKGQRSEKSGFPAEVKDLTKRIRTVLMATAQMKEHENDPEMLIDLQNSLAKSYASTPELRKTWLETMAKIHNKHENFSEAAHCYIHIAALVAEYLKRRGSFPQGCAAFKSLSPNIEMEESGIKDDSGMQDVQYTEETMVDYLEQAARSLEKAERYEVLGEVYKLIIPIYEFAREYESLSTSYTHLATAYTKVVEVTASGKRLLGKYFRVAFYGQIFDDEGGKEFIYKEPKVTSLAEICERLNLMYSEKFGKDNVKLIKDSKKVDPSTLDVKLAHIQVTHVTPYFDDKEIQRRVTEFERNNNIKRFMYETPFTQSGKAHGEIEEQCKRRTILTTSHSFPFVKKRIEIVDRKEVILQPIEVAIDQMQAKVIDMREVVNLSRPDLKKLQLKLQGSVSAQVNAGPLAYAQAFLGKDKVKSFPGDSVEMLKDIFRDFVSVCNDALDLNATLITTEQKEYHESLNSGFQEIVTKLSDMFGEKILTTSDAGSLSQRGSMTVFNIVSTTSSTSSA